MNMTSTNSDPNDLQEKLDSLAQLLPSAMTAEDDIRARMATCWATRPSLRALGPDDRAPFDSARRLAAGGRWEYGQRSTAVDAADNTLRALGHEPTDLPGSQPWPYGKVDPQVELSPTPAASRALRAAVKTASEGLDAIHRQLDEITRLQPAETWLPKWGIDDARVYIGRVKWQRARPPQPPHEYTVRDWRPDLDRSFLAVAQLIQSQGVLKTWGGYVTAYLEVEGLDYWTMGARVLETTVINPAPLAAPSAAQPLSSLSATKLRKAVRAPLEYRRVGPAGDAAVAGTLGQRLRQLLSTAEAAPSLRRTHPARADQLRQSEPTVGAVRDSRNPAKIRYRPSPDRPNGGTVMPESILGSDGTSHPSLSGRSHRSVACSLRGWSPCRRSQLGVKAASVRSLPRSSAVRV
jgi:hypothetical protein